MTYVEEKALKNNQKTNQICESLPYYIADFFSGISDTTQSSTRLGYAYDLKNFFDFLSRKPKNYSIEQLSALKKTDIDRFMNSIGKTNSAQGKARKLSSIKALFEYLIDREVIPYNTIIKYKPPSIHKKNIVKLDEEETENLIDIISDTKKMTAMQQRFSTYTNDRDMAIVTLFLLTGMRVSELVGININDIDLRKKTIKITRKGGNEQLLYLGDEVLELLTKYLKGRPNIEDENALFISLQDKRISVRAVQDIVKKYSDLAGKKISPHKLRATYATKLYDLTGDIKLVADALGHANVNTTQERYAAKSESKLIEAANKMSLRMCN